MEVAGRSQVFGDMLTRRGRTQRIRVLRGMSDLMLKSGLRRTNSESPIGSRHLELKGLPGARVHNRYVAQCMA
jgi:hypothetical protein